MKTKKHRAEVIEIYPEISKCAVKFRYNGKDRVECVRYVSGADAFPISVGSKGWASYYCNGSVGLWSFTPSQKKEAA